MRDRRCTEEEFLALSYQGEATGPMTPIHRGLTIILDDCVIIFLEDAE